MPRIIEDKNMCRCIRIGVYVNTYEFDMILLAAGSTGSLSEFLRNIILKQVAEDKEEDAYIPGTKQRA